MKKLFAKSEEKFLKSVTLYASDSKKATDNVLILYMDEGFTKLAPIDLVQDLFNKGILNIDYERIISGYPFHVEAKALSVYLQVYPEQSTTVYTVITYCPKVSISGTTLGEEVAFYAVEVNA